MSGHHNDSINASKIIYNVFTYSGKEFGCGIYVVKVMSSSKAAQNGLKVINLVNILHRSPLPCTIYKAWGSDCPCEWIDSL